MSMSKLLPLASAVSLGIGGVLGIGLERSRKRGNSDSEAGESLGMKYYLPLPTVYAKTTALTTLSPSLPGQTGVAPGNRVSEIMKHGFPSLDNVRAFDDFVLAYDKRNRTAHWVFEHLTQDHVKRVEGISRDETTFNEDESVHHYFRGTNQDYKKSGYDRGHLAAAGNHRWSQKAMDQTFTLSNIAPQVMLKGGNYRPGATFHLYLNLIDVVCDIMSKIRNPTESVIIHDHEPHHAVTAHVYQTMATTGYNYFVSTL